MKAVLAVVLLVGITTFAMAAGEKITMTYDLGAENPKWKFAAGQWVRRASGGRQVLAQTAATQPWAVAVLEDQKFEDVDVSVRGGASRNFESDLAVMDHRHSRAS